MQLLYAPITTLKILHSANQAYFFACILEQTVTLHHTALCDSFLLLTWTVCTAFCEMGPKIKQVMSNAARVNVS